MHDACLPSNGGLFRHQSVLSCPIRAQRVERSGGVNYFPNQPTGPVLLFEERGYNNREVGPRRPGISSLGQDC
jgi:hypothetical protein